MPKKKLKNVNYDDVAWDFWADKYGFIVTRENYEAVCESRDYRGHVPFTERSIEKYLGYVIEAVNNGYVSSINQAFEIWADHGWVAPMAKWFIQYSPDPFHHSKEYKSYKGLH